MSMNVVALAGRLSRPAVEKVLDSGDRLVALEVTIRPEEGKTETVPVVWFGAPASAAALDVEQPVVVVGRVRRRFFRAGERTQSRTEVVADAVVPATQRKRVETVLRKAHESLGDALLG
ncbi:MAG: single-stranded DNA-binding protein [Actinobacteria bacterium]|nr:single-stranded DNA-binding protein [Actinomycetota bacterium]